jgi:hypothetical protein
VINWIGGKRLVGGGEDEEKKQIIICSPSRKEMQLANLYFLTLRDLCLICMPSYSMSRLMQIPVVRGDAQPGGDCAAERIFSASELSVVWHALR